MTDDTDARIDTAAAPASQSERLRELLVRSVELLGQIDALSQQQRPLIESGETDRLLGVMRQRDGLALRLAEVESEARPLLDRFEAIAGAASESVARDLEQRAAGVTALARSISDRDRDDIAAMEAARDAAAGGLVSNRRSAAATKAYGGPLAPRYQDRTG